MNPKKRRAATAVVETDLDRENVFVIAAKVTTSEGLAGINVVVLTDEIGSLDKRV
jgi:hypothetical protein